MALPPRLRVLQVITSLAGGAGLHALQLAQQLDPARFEVLLAYGPGYPLDAVVQQQRLPHRLLRWQRRLRPWHTAQGLMDLARLLHGGRFDIVHAHCSLAGAATRVLAPLLCARPHRLLFTVHALAAHAGQPAWRQALLTGVERALDGLTDRYVVTTQRYRDELQQRGIAAPDKVSVIPLGIAAPAELPRAEARRRLGLQPDDEVVMFSGRLEPQKGLPVLLQAWALLQPQRPRARLVIVGDGPQRAACQALAGSDSVLWAGWQPDAAALMSAADLFCLPSLWEAYGYVLLEAMAAGVPIVASDVGGIPEALGQGRWGRLCPPGDAQALATLLLHTLADPAASAATVAAARRHVQQEHGLHTMVARHAQLYEQLAGAGRPAAASAPPGEVHP